MFSGIGLKLDFRPDISGLDKSIKPYAVSAQRELDGFLSFNIQPSLGRMRSRSRRQMFSSRMTMENIKSSVKGILSFCLYFVMIKSPSKSINNCNLFTGEFYSSSALAVKEKK